jgi:hypothetical protein
MGPQIPERFASQQAREERLLTSTDPGELGNIVEDAMAYEEANPYEPLNLGMTAAQESDYIARGISQTAMAACLAEGRAARFNDRALQMLAEAPNEDVRNLAHAELDLRQHEAMTGQSIDRRRDALRAAEGRRSMMRQESALTESQRILDLLAIQRTLRKTDLSLVETQKPGLFGRRRHREQVAAAAERYNQSLDAYANAEARRSLLLGGLNDLRQTG